jgi:endogenous inhibitor of DNA gyrase (YacG/DUF329 family)
MANKSEEGLRCFICKAPVPPRPANKAFPFCSARCQTIDLGHWLSGDYRIPEDAKAVDESEGEHEPTDPPSE